MWIWSQKEVILVGESRNDHTDSVATPHPINSTASSFNSLPNSSGEAVPSSSAILNDDDLPGVSFSEGTSVLSTNASYITNTEIYEMFPNFSKKAVDMIYLLTSKNAALTINTLLDISAERILCLLQQQKMNSAPITLKVDEDDLFDDVLMFYKQ